jgi:putative membrane protein
LVDKLTGLSGEQFDKEYMAAMTDNHAAGMQNFELQAKIGVDAEIRDLANETLPVLREHLKIAKDIAARQSADGR